MQITVMANNKDLCQTNSLSRHAVCLNRPLSLKRFKTHSCRLTASRWNSVITGTCGTTVLAQGHVLNDRQTSIGSRDEFLASDQLQVTKQQGVEMSLFLCAGADPSQEDAPSRPVERITRYYAAVLVAPYTRLLYFDTLFIHRCFVGGYLDLFGPCELTP